MDSDECLAGGRDRLVDFGEPQHVSRSVPVLEDRLQRRAPAVASVPIRFQLDMTGSVSLTP
jgi:hypothetical protein